MGAVEDLRKLLQDVVTPDLKAIDVRLTAIEKRLDGRIDVLDKKIDILDKKLDSTKADLDKKLDSTKADLEKRLDSTKADLEKKLDSADKKLEHTAAQLEDKMRVNQDAVMSEIRHLLFQMNSNFASIQHSLDIDRRLERIESGFQADRAGKLERTS